MQQKPNTAVVSKILSTKRPLKIPINIYHISKLIETTKRVIKKVLLLKKLKLNKVHTKNMIIYK